MNLYEILPDRLYVSGKPGELLHPFLTSGVCLVDCIHDLDLLSTFSPVFVRAPFDDEPLDIYGSGARTFHRLSDIAILVHSFLIDQEKVLIHCLEGKNRSVFLAGLVLLCMKKNKDITLGNVVAYLRNKRPGALDPGHDNFAQILNMLEGT